MSKRTYLGCRTLSLAKKKAKKYRFHGGKILTEKDAEFGELVGKRLLDPLEYPYVVAWNEEA